MFTMGDDFQYQDARTWFINLDKIIKYVNARVSGSLSKMKKFQLSLMFFL